MNLFTPITRWFWMSITLLAFACSSNDNKPAEVGTQAPSIVGTYQDDYGLAHRITQSTWVMDTSVFHIVQVDNPHAFLTAHNDTNNQSFPDKYSRFDWAHDEQSVLYFCQTAYDAETAEKALQTAAANAGDLTSGCSGFPWSKLIPVTEDAGVN